MTDKDKVPTKLLWVDLEMTGLDPAHDVILEIAAEVTDFDLKTHKEGRVESGQVFPSTHPLVKHKLSRLRSIET